MGSFKTIRKSRCSARPSDPRLALALRALKHVEFLMQTAEAALKSVPRVVAEAIVSQVYLALIRKACLRAFVPC